MGLKSDRNFVQMSLDGVKKPTWLSYSALEMLNRCPRCFWLTYNKKIRQPEGIQSRLANRFDIILKKYFDSYRKRNALPPMVKNKIKGSLQNPFKEKYFYKINDHFSFYGKLDECFVDKDKHIPVDFKTSSSDPREKETLSAYQNQMDAYAFLMEKNGCKTAGYGYLIYFYPELSDNVHSGFPMIIFIQKIITYPEKVGKRIEKAINILENNIPQSFLECPFCLWFGKVKKYF